MLNNFTNKNNKLYIGSIPAERLVQEFGSPIYVYDTALIKQRYNDLVSSITYPKTIFHYACKANNNVEVIRLLKQLGAHIETVSPREVEIAFHVGYKPEEVAFTCSNLSRDELAWLIGNNVLVNLDSLTQLRRWGEIRPGSAVSLRINQGIGAGHHEHTITGGIQSKFGIDREQLREAKQIAKKYHLRINGLHQHIGSGILDEGVFLLAMEKLLETAMDFPDLEYLDFGGGFGVRHQEEEQSLNMASLGEKITKRLTAFMKSYGKELAVRFEPGRFLVAESGVLLTSVVEIKRNPHKTFVGINAGMNHLIRPAMYGAYQQIVHAGNVKGDEEVVSVVGNICESADFFAKELSLPKFVEGDILAILDSGAYGYSMSSNYNARSQPAEVMVDGAKARVIRKEYVL